MIESLLEKDLSEIAEAFLDVVPKNYEGLPVIRYSIETIPNLTGDDTFLSKRHNIQIDVYAKKREIEIENQLEEWMKENYFSFNLKQPGKENGRTRVLYQISIEE